jgi:small-conductance mechanosensitive channel
VNIHIGIAYKESIEDARKSLLGTLAGDNRILAEPPPVVNVVDCADSSVNLVLRFWIEDEAAERLMKAEYLEKSKNALDRAGISIPFPHMQVFLEETTALKSITHQRAA